MNQQFGAEEFDRKLELMLTASAVPQNGRDPLVEIAAQLLRLPSPAFKERLRADLLTSVETEEETYARPPAVLAAAATEFLLSLRQPKFSMMPADPRSLLFSFLSHAAVVLLIASGIWVGHRTILKDPTLVSRLTFIPLPAGDTAPHGGGSGGDHSMIAASKGTPPKFSNEQLAPPIVVARNLVPKLQVDSSVLGAPDLKLPQLNKIGDLLSTNTTIPSNGTGGNTGIGNNHGTGIGTGDGPGLGNGKNGGCCSGAYRPGNGVSAPLAIYDPDPEYSEEARKNKFSGIVTLTIIVDPSGRPRDIRVVRSLGMGLDEKAVEAVEKWKFTPGMKDGMPVAVQVNVEVSFRLY